MMDHHGMDVDTPSSGGLSASSSSSMLDLAGVDLDALNIKMKLYSESFVWSRFAEANHAQWILLCAQVLECLLSEVAKTELKSSVIAPPGLEESCNILRRLETEELEQWNIGMRNGVEKNDWSSLIMHPKLRNPMWPKVALGVPMELKDAVVSAWGMQYHGNAHATLLQAIDDLHVLPVEQSYAKIIPIAQSSGTGKSKTVDVVAMERILFPMCLREELGKNYFAYPLSDTAVRNYFYLAPGTADEVRCKAYIRSFLSSLFASAHLEVQQLIPMGTKTYVQMAKLFYDLFANPLRRMRFYEVVVKNAETRRFQNVQQSFQELQEGLKQRCSNWPSNSVCPILISFDEVHVLYTHRKIDIGSDYTLYSRMKSVLNEVVMCAFGVVSLSTASQIPRLAPSKENAPSVRERDDERLLPAPFTELPFDVHIIANPLVPNKATLTSVGTLEFAAKFGRPLFYSSYLSRKGSEASMTDDVIMHIIREKLSGRTWPPEAPAKLDVSSIAILSARLLLDLSPAAVYAKRFEEELVRNHLRMLYSVHENRQTIVTGSSPEPLIAEASAQIMNYNMNGSRYMDLWHLLMEFVDHGLAWQGAIGELIGRALSISAMDHAINGLRKVCDLKYQTPVRVADYYKALLTDDAWKDLRQSIPANRTRLSLTSASKTFEDAFEDAYFHFSHYAKANDSTPMRDKYAWAIWLRGTAVVCQLNQDLTDRMAPVYFSSRGNVSPETVSVNLDQDKTGQSVNPCGVGIQSAEDLFIFSHAEKLPYIAAVHCYALTENQGITVTRPTQYNFRLPMYDMEAPRYQIDFRGLSAYRNITNEVSAAIQAMINRSKDALFINHSRDYGVPALRQMLPVLTGHQAATKWFGGCG
ncbi:hypothetical protein BU17DRAFT_95797 [Hysterangium stoloniferum]|nr:hypothetical protein BU17DRAFT_95797 [Hysterangium stoloniferum]